MMNRSLKSKLINRIIFKSTFYSSRFCKNHYGSCTKNKDIVSYSAKVTSMFAFSI